MVLVLMTRVSRARCSVSKANGAPQSGDRFTRRVWNGTAIGGHALRAFAYPTPLSRPYALLPKRSSME
jgi:hypothetical protein